MKISIVIPAYNEEHYIGPASRACRRSIAMTFLRSSWSTTDRPTRPWPRQKNIDGVTVFREPQKGPSHARQRGFMEAKGDYIAFIDADTRVPAGWIDTIKKEFAQDPNSVCLSGPFRYYDLAPFQKFLAELLWGITAAPTYWLVGFMALFANCVVKREALAQIGGHRYYGRLLR